MWDWQRDDSETTGFRILKGHNDHVTGVAFSPKKVDLPVHGPTWLLASAGRDGTLRLWNTHTGDELHPEKRMKGYTTWLTSAVFSPDCSQIVAPGEGIRRLHAKQPCGAVFLEWADDPSKRARELPLKGPQHTDLVVNDAVFIPDGSLCITAASDGLLRVWDTKDGSLLTRLEGHYGDIARLALDPTSSRLVSEARDGMGIVWDLTDLRNRAKDPGRILTRLTGLSGRFAAIAISPGGRWVITEHGSLGARLFDLTTIKPGKIPTGAAVHDEQGMISAVAFSPAPAQPRYATAGIDGSAWVGIAETNLDKKKRPIFLAGLRFVVSGVAFSSDGKLVAAVSGDNRVRVWDSETGAERASRNRPERGRSTPWDSSRLHSDRPIAGNLRFLWAVRAAGSGTKEPGTQIPRRLFRHSPCRLERRRQENRNDRIRSCSEGI